MKIRRDFVTNSSSSSYVCVARVDLCDELREYMKEEFGKFGLRLLDENIQTGAQIKAEEYNQVKNELEFFDKLDALEDDKYYLGASFIEWTNEGETDREDAFLYNNIPQKFMEEIHRGDAD